MISKFRQQRSARRARAARRRQDLYLGAALVVGLPEEGSKLVDVQLTEAPGGRVTAQLALPVAYQPAVGDLLLTIGRESGYFVIGVLVGTGTTSLTFPGDVELRALGGALKLVGDTEVKLVSQQATIQVDTLRTFAREVTEKAGSAYRWIRETLSVRAGESRMLVEGEALTQAKRTTILAEEVAKMDGGQVQLGH